MLSKIRRKVYLLEKSSRGVSEYGHSFQIASAAYAKVFMGLLVSGSDEKKWKLCCPPSLSTLSVFTENSKFFWSRHSLTRDIYDRFTVYAKPRRWTTYFRAHSSSDFHRKMTARYKRVNFFMRFVSQRPTFREKTSLTKQDGDRQNGK